MKILHVVPGLDDPTNGIAKAAKLIAAKQGRMSVVEMIEARDFCDQIAFNCFNVYSEVWVHSMWLPRTMRACWKVIQLKRANFHSTTTTSGYNSPPRLVRMTHANLDPLRYRYHGWKKRLVAPIELWLFKHTDCVVVTCEAEKKWCQQWGLKNEFEILDLKKFFDLKDKEEGVGARSRKIKAPRLVALAEAVQAVVHHQTTPSSCPQDKNIIPNPQMPRKGLRLLYLGRRHPLKGVEFLERAVEELKQTFEHSEHSNNRTLELRIVSNHFGDELENDWSWCDVLVLPTLSENFGLVVAEALERGKQVITTDGAPVWERQPGVIYLKGFRDGTDAERVRLLKNAIRSLV